MNGLRRKEEFDAIHRVEGQVILVISDTAISVGRVLDIRQRSGDMSLSQDAMWSHIQQEKKDLDSLQDDADLVIVNNFDTKEAFISFAKKQITTFFNI